MPEEVDRPRNKAGSLHRLLDGAEEIGRGRHRDEGKADREQHLVEVAGAIEPPVEHALEEDADDRSRDEGDRQRREERPASRSPASTPT